MLGDITCIDVEGTNVPTYGKRKTGVDISYKGTWGYHPLVISLANTKEVLFLVNRQGNVPSHTDSAQCIDTPRSPWYSPTPSVCVYEATPNFP